MVKWFIPVESSDKKKFNIFSNMFRAAEINLTIFNNHKPDFEGQHIKYNPL